jgi:hypothetical protein
MADAWDLVERVLDGKEPELLGWVGVVLAADKGKPCAKCRVRQAADQG